MAEDKTPETKRHERKRNLIQLAAAAFFNGYAAGFVKGEIFTGKTKILCVPVLNCYSCPGALGSCPIGSLQAVISSRKHRMSFYVLGLIMLFGIVLGRLICGFLCPFGLLQDLLHKIPVRKIRINRKADRVMRYLKYVVLAVLVILLPILIRNPLDMGQTWFCKYVCPAGTVAGLSLILANPVMQEMIGILFSWKTCLLLIVLISSTMIHRPFCKYLCPLGALYGLFSRFSLYQMHLDKSKCIGCGKCEKACPMDVRCTQDINTAECIRCGKCKAACPVHAIDSTFGFDLKKKLEKADGTDIKGN